MKNINLSIIIFFILGLVSCGGSSTQNNKFEQYAYYKNTNNYRVFVYITAEASIEEIKSHAQKQINTDGRTTIVCYYRTSEGLNNNSITLAKNEHIAMECAFKPGIMAIYWKYATGKESFIENPYKE